MYHGSLFSGLGGFDLAASWVGWNNAFHSDIDPFCLTILKHHFPNATAYTDIRGTDFTPWRNRIDILSGGFPCPPFSQAGKRKGTADDRYLWPEMYRAICEIRPRWVVAENVLGIVNWNGGVVFEQVHLDLEAAGYSVQTFVLPACGINAPHQRYRTWFVAHRNDDQLCSGIQFDEQFGQTAFADGGVDAGDSNGNGIDAQSGSSVKSSSKPGGICGTGGLGTDSDGLVRGSRTNTENTAGTGLSVEDGSRTAADSRLSGLEGQDKTEYIENRRPEIWTNVAGCDNEIAADPESGRFQRGLTARGRSDGNPAERLHFLDGIAGSGLQRTIANTQREGSDELCNDIQSQQPNGEWPDSEGTQWHASESENQRIYRGSAHESCNRQNEEWQRGAIGEMPNFKDWLDFPTQSPVCSRNDGFPIPMDGITFPRWRKESIKAYGNAIVPQVAYRIFRVIELMTNGK